MSNNDFWFYALSSISQTVAAIIALSAMFGIFKLDHIQRLKQAFLSGMNRFLMLLNYGSEIPQIIEMVRKDNDIKNLLKPINKLDIQKEDLGLGDELYQKYAQEMNYIILGVRGQYHSTKDRIYGYLRQQQSYFERIASTKRDIYRKLLKSIIANVFIIVLSLSLIPLPNKGILFSIITIYSVIFLTSIAIIYTAYCILIIAKYEI